MIVDYLLIKTNLLDFDIQYTRNFSNLTIVIFISSIPIKSSCKISLKAKVGFESPINTKSMNSSVLFKTLLSFNSEILSSNLITIVSIILIKRFLCFCFQSQLIEMLFKIFNCFLNFQIL